MKQNFSSTKLILLHPYIQKQGTSNRLWLFVVISFLTLTSVATLVYTRASISTTSVTASITATRAAHAPLSDAVVRALVHYASNSNQSYTMSHSDMKQISDTLRQCSRPCNFFVFGLTHETLLWKALNANGRTVFIDENRYYAAHLEEKYPDLEIYDVQYSTKLSKTSETIAAVKEQVKNECRPVQNLLFSECKLGLNDLPNQLYSTKLSETSETIAAVKEQVKNECRPVQNLLFSECKLGLNDLPNQLYSTKLSETSETIAAVKEQVKNECRPVQNLLFSECKLGLNDLPNQLYEVDWDLILVDGPRGYWPEAPGRMAAIFTAGVLARSKKGGNPKTHVFVHDFNMKVDRITSDEFLCRENLVKAKEMMGHFVLEQMDINSSEFCPSNRHFSTLS